MSVRLSCPSCNTNFTLDALPGDRRASCPRCGDVFPIRGEIVEEGSGDRGQGSEDKGQTAAPLPTAKPQGRPAPRAAFIAITLALIAVAVGLVVYYTRGPKTPPTQPQKPAVASANATPPKELVGLGYLPECNVVFAVQPGPVIVYAERTKQDPRAVLTQTGIPQPALAAIDSLGLPLAEIDHVVGGAFIGNEGDDFRIAIVLVLKQPVADEAAFLDKLKAKPVQKKDARWNVTLNNAKFSPLLARVSPTVWAFGLNEGDFSSVNKGGLGPGGSDAMRKMAAAIPADAAVWVAADDPGDWTQKPIVKLAMQSAEAKKWVPAVAGARGGSVAVSFGEKPRVNLHARTADAATATRVRAYFRARAAEIESAKVLEPADETTAGFEAPYNPATSWNLLQRFLDDARK